MTNKIIVGISVAVAFILVFLLVASYYLKKESEIVLEYKHVKPFETEVITKNYRQYLLISGEYYGNIRVRTTMLGNTDSSFIYAVKLDKKVNRVLFGNEKKIIWERSANTEKATSTVSN